MLIKFLVKKNVPGKWPMALLPMVNLWLGDNQEIFLITDEKSTAT